MSPVFPFLKVIRAPSCFACFSRHFSPPSFGRCRNTDGQTAPPLSTLLPFHALSRIVSELISKPRLTPCSHLLHAFPSPLPFPSLCYSVRVALSPFPRCVYILPPCTMDAQVKKAPSLVRHRGCVVALWEASRREEDHQELSNRLYLF